MAQITRTNIAQIRADIEAAMKAIYAKHGVDVVVGRITYTDSNFRCKIEGNVRGATATAPVTPKTAALPRAAWMLGDKFDETKVYQSAGLGRVKITGYNAKAHKYPFIVKRLSTGQSYKLSLIQAKDIVDNGEVA